MRLAIILGSALLLLAAPRAASAQVYCASRPTNSSGYASYVPTGYSSYSGFASFPGGMASGALPSGYSTNPYVGCAPTTATTSANPIDQSGGGSSPPSYSAVIASNVYNPYSGWGIPNAASYPFASYGANTTPGSANTPGNPTTSTNFAAFPGMAPSGSLTVAPANTPRTSSPSNTTVSQSTAAAAPFSAPAAPTATMASYGGYTPPAGSSIANNGATYYNAAGVSIYYGGADPSGNAPAPGAVSALGASTYGTAAAVAPGAYGTGPTAAAGVDYGGASQYTYGNGASFPVPDAGAGAAPAYGCDASC